MSDYEIHTSITDQEFLGGVESYHATTIVDQPHFFADRY